MISKTRNQLARIHQTFGINRCFNRTHDRDGVFAMLGHHEIKLAIANAMFAGAGAAKFKCTFYHALVQAVGFFHLGRIFGIKQDQGMEVAIANMTNDRAGQRAGIAISTGF